MKLLETVGNAPVFETGYLLAGDVDPAHVRRQLSRWTRAGWLYQLRRGIYTLAPPHQKIKAHPFVVANALVRGSYVSLQTALAYYGLIPDVTPVTTSVSSGRPARWETPLGGYEFRHIKAEWIRGYQRLDLGDGQAAFVAMPEKALLDLIHLQTGGDDPAYLAALRLQALDSLDLVNLVELAERSDSPKLIRAVQVIKALALQQAEEYGPL